MTAFTLPEICHRRLFTLHASTLPSSTQFVWSTSRDQASRVSYVAQTLGDSILITRPCETDGRFRVRLLQLLGGTAFNIVLDKGMHVGWL